MYKVGIIGAGKVGVSLGLYMFLNNEKFKLNGYYSKSCESSNYAANITNSTQYKNLEKLVEKSNILIITTPDDIIKEVWGIISNFNIQNKLICHCSGSLSSNVFFDISQKGAFGSSMHPLLAINSKEKSYKELKDVFFTLEGDNKAVSVLEKLLKSLGNRYKIINSSDKTKYHLASVFISNLVIGLGNISLRLLKEYGFSEKEGLDAINYLSYGNIGKFLKKGGKESLTGPVERNDCETVCKHITSMRDLGDRNMEDIYRLISLELLEIAKEKHSEKNYTMLKKILEEGETL